MKFKKSFLVEKLAQNRAKHEAEFNDAKVDYNRLVVEKLEEALEKAKTGKELDRIVYLPVPCTSHLKDYDRVIEMLNATVDDEITLSQKDYAEYVMDDWEWKENFTSVSNSYKNGRL